jgi:opacity protein-like surface antigen
MGWLRTSGASGTPSAISGAPHGRHRDSSRRGRGPRAGLAALALILLAPAGAVAADMPDFLRGSYTPTYTRWEGFYVGGQAGQTWGTADFSNSSTSMISYILAETELAPIVSNWKTLPKGSTGAASFGGFIGYNYQWNDVVMGGELNYDHMSLGTGQQGSIGPILVPGANLPDGTTVLYSVQVASTASVAIHDIMTARLRGGWVVDNFMPYGFIGLAVGRADVSRSTTLAGSTVTTTPPPTTDAFGNTIPGVPVTGPLLLPRDPQSQVQTGVFAYGFSAGLGVEVALMQNLFARAEWEFVEFPNISDIRVSANSARVGVGLKF